MIRFAAISVTAALFLVMPLTGLSRAQVKRPANEQLVVCMIQLEHADAEELAATMRPLLSTEGSIVAYRPTNTLIIKDRASVVEKLSIAIKGRPCSPITDPPDVEAGNVNEQPHID